MKAENHQDKFHFYPKLMSTTTLNTMNKKSNNLNLKMILMMRVKKKTHPELCKLIA